MTADRYRSPLGTRYSSPAMQRLWGERYRIGLWRRIWLALAESERELGLEIPVAALAEMHRTLAVGGRLVAVTPAPIRASTRLMVGLVDWLSGSRLGSTLTPYDPTSDFDASGFTVRQHIVVEKGYRSHCVLGDRRDCRP